MAFITVTSDIERTQKALENTNKSIKTIQRKTLGIIGRKTLQAVRRAITSSGIKGTGAFKKAYRYHITRNNNEVNIYPRLTDEKKNRQWAFGLASILNEGREVFAKKRKYLTFAINGEWKKVKSITQKPHNFIEAGRAYADSGAYNAEIDKMIEKELSKFWG